MKTLYLVRHAKSSWDDQFTTDHDRPLNERGYRNAPQIGAYLAARAPMPDLIVSSTANRAATTARLIAEQWQYPVENIQEKNLLYWFDYDMQHLVSMVQDTPDTVKSLMMTGHNPTFTHLTNYFLKRHQFDELPTCAVVCLVFDTDSWTNVSEIAAQLQWHIFPKMLP